MKKFLKYFGITIGSIILCLYLAFLFILPYAIDLNKFIPEVQKIVKEQADIDLSVDKIRISTNPLLQAGIKTGKITAKLPDGSVLLESDGLKVRISLPNLIFLTIKVSCAEVKSPKVNLEIINGEQYKVVRLVEDILNKKKNEPETEAKPLPIDPSRIKIKVPNLRITDYNVIIDDLKSSHKLTLKGEELTGAYNNKKTAKLKTKAVVLSDENVNIKADIDLDSFIPPASEKDQDDDPAEKIELPFVNPVLVYRNYDLKSNVEAKLKLRQDKNNKPYMKGYLNVDKTSVNLSGLQLPESYIKVKFNGDTADIDTDIVVAPKQEIKLIGKVNYGQNPYLNLDLFTDKIYFNDMVILAKAFLDTLQVKNNLAYLKAKGYWIARTHIKSDFKKLKSDGSIIARDGSIANGATRLVFDKIRANLIFEDDKLKITDTHTYINGSLLEAEGIIDTDAYSDITVHSEKLPLPGLFLAFAPADLKRNFSLTSGTLSLDAKVQGMLKQPVAYANANISGLVLTNDNFNINNEKLVAGLVTDLKTIDGNITNKNFRFNIPKTNSVIQNPLLSVKLNERDIDILPADILINANSKVNVTGELKEYSSDPVIKFTADGYLNSSDLRKFAGEAAVPFIEAKGNLPIKALVAGTDKKQSVVMQIKSDADNYLTPVEIQSMLGKQSILQAKFDLKKDKLHIKKTGLYTGISSFTNEFEENLSGAQKIAEINGTIIYLNTNQPFINMIKIDFPNMLNAKFTAFKNSRFKFDGGLLVFGKLASPVLRGEFKISELSIPELLTMLNEANVNMSGKNIVLDVRRLLLNGSDVNLNVRTDINPHPVFTISGVDLQSNLIDLDKILKVPELLSKYTVQSSNNAAPSDIPVIIRRGSINIRNLKSGEILAQNTTGRISMGSNNFFLNDLNTSVFDGAVGGDIVVNLISMLVDVKTTGGNLNVEKALYGLAGMKDTLSGTLSFNTDINFKATTPEEIMKSLKGDVNFSIADGQLGPFGKLENMILAENIRESKFFQTAIGGVINNLASVDTSRFKTMDGLITFEDGFAHINPIITQGTVMSLRLVGDFNLIENQIDMKVRAKLGSVVANLLGPLAQLNPINLIEATPGLNVVMAKTFFMFCEQLTPEETEILPHLENPMDDKLATKFQIVLRGDVAKPLTLVKSFKWLALASEIQKAENFVNTLPDPSVVGDENATLEEILQAQKENEKLKNKIIRFFKREK